MPKKILQLSIFILLACLTTNAYTQDKSNLDNEINEIKTQNKILQQSLEELKNHSAELNTIYMWALGFSATFLITFLGVNIYFLNSKSKDELEKINTKLITLNQEAQGELQAKIDQKLEILNEALETHKKNNSKQIESKHSITLSKLNDLKYDVLLMEIDNLTKEGNEQLLLTKHIKLIDFIIEGYGPDRRDWQISKSLSELITLQRKGKKFSNFDFGDVYKILSKLPSQYSDHVSQIKSHLTP